MRHIAAHELTENLQGCFLTCPISYAINMSGSGMDGSSMNLVLAVTHLFGMPARLAVPRL